MDNQPQKNRQTYAIGLFFSLVIMMNLFVTQSASATTEKAITFVTPEHLKKTDLSDPNAVVALLNNKTFVGALTTIAKKLSAEKMAEQSSFNTMALLSSREEYQQLIEAISQDANPISYYYYQLYAQTKLAIDSNASEEEFIKQLQQAFANTTSTMSDERLYEISAALGWSTDNAASFVTNVYKNYQAQDSLTENQAIDMIVNTQIYQVISRVIPISDNQLAIENERRYVIEPETIIKTPAGVELAATIVRKKGDSKRRATAMQFTIYADEAWHIKTAIHAAAHGFVGVVANTRGKRGSSNTIIPWEKDGEDATAVIEWITKQSWSNGKVGMYGGSYNGFTQWAAAKFMHPALKAIVPYSAANPLTGLPLENNIYLTDNYAWAFHVTNNKTTDNSVYADWEKTNQLKTTLFESGSPLKDIDKIDGTPNPWFQKWLQHPSYDSFYQNMLPYKSDFSRINIPVLSVTGYFDGGQISAIDFLNNHYQHNRNAEHYLLIGPYNHGTAQGIPNSHHSNYALDPVAMEKNTEEIALNFIDHVINKAPKPKLLKNRINYQLMGANTWQHTQSYKAMNQQGKTFFLTGEQDNVASFQLSDTQSTHLSSFTQTVDMTDRTERRNGTHWQVIRDELSEPNGLIFMTAPMDKPQQLAGAITGKFNISVNKKDVDIGYNFYEILPDGKTFHLNNYRGRASYAKDMSKRTLLVPNEKTEVPIVNGRMTAKLINKGSRLAIVLNVNKNEDAQVNLGSGKDVSTETLADAGEPLVIKWFNDSQIKLPLNPWHVE